EGSDKFTTTQLSVDFKKAGAVLKGDVQKLKILLTNASAEEMQKAVEGYNSGAVNIGEFRNLSPDIFIVSSKPKQEFVIASENGITVVLDTTIDENLMLEGLFREVVRSAQVLRKEANFKIEQRINIFVSSLSEDINKMLSVFKTKLMQEVLAVTFEKVENPDISKEIEVAGEKVLIELKTID
ncbi:MAG: DUF5915 domain-containing protein, partial [Christensenellales bacterium]